VIVVQRKDGTVQRFPHGIYKANVRFWGSEAEGQDVESLSPEMNLEFPQIGFPGQQVTSAFSSQVTAFRKNEQGEYAVFLLWPHTAPVSLPDQLCLGTQPQVDAQHCDSVFSVSVPKTYYYTDIETYCFIGLGADNLLGRLLADGQLKGRYYSYSQPEQRLVLPLRHGQTYYYRIAAHIPSLRSDGGHDTLTVYGPEYSFRIPDLMTESDEVPTLIAKDGLVYPSPQAWEQYRTAHFEADVELPDAEAFGKMWMQWRQTPQGQTLDTSTAVPHVYDDGTIHFLSAVPEAFHEWAMSREIIITDLADTNPVTIYVMNQWQPQSEWSMVTTGHEDWPLPLSTYIKATPLPYTGASNINAAIDFDTRGMMPGVTYQLTVTFAPEGELPQTEENAWYYTPTRLQMGFYSGAKSNVAEYLINREQTGYVGTKYFLQSGTEPTTFTFTAPAGAAPNRFLHITSALRSPDLNSKAQINVLRVAEVRLTPVSSF